MRVFFSGLAALTILFAIVIALNFRSFGTPLLTSKTLWGLGSVAAFLLAAAFKFKPKQQKRVMVVILAVLGFEAVLQLLAAIGVLPIVNSKLKAPYSRVYWSSEGRGNSVRNRWGWYYPDFDTRATNRIAAIGASLVEAVEVKPEHIHTWLLHKRLKALSPEYSVLGLGNYGSSPAFYLEVLNYAKKHFEPREAVIYIALRNDIQESSPKLHHMPPEKYEYFDLDRDGKLIINPASLEARRRFLEDLEFCHGPFLRYFPTIILSHCMTLQLIRGVRDAEIRRQDQSARKARNQAESLDVDADGINLMPFANQRSPDVEHALAVLEAELARCKEICDGYGMKLRLVSVPVFPRVFYDTQQGTNWTMKIGNYDFLRPERELAAFAHSNGIPILSLGNYIQSRNISVGQIRGLFLHNGIGHFTDKGHQLCADAVFEEFYSGAVR